MIRNAVSISMLFFFASIAACEESCYLFSSFRNNGENGLYIAYSHDGLTWMPIHDDQSMLPPLVGKDKLMRDPCILLGPDGVFHMVWTISWKEKGIGIAHSKDLIEWSPQELLPVMHHEPGAQNCWAPEIFYDDLENQYLIFWATTILDRFPDTVLDNQSTRNHRIYCTTTKDFTNYSETKLFYDPGFSVIDSTLVKRGERDYVMILKDETYAPAEKNLKLAFATKPTGPWSPASEPFTQKELDWVEGPTVLRIGDAWHVYFDRYRKHDYGCLVTRDWTTWDNVSHRLTYPKGMRHGTVLEAPCAVLKTLLEREK